MFSGVDDQFQVLIGSVTPALNLIVRIPQNVGISFHEISD